LPFSAEKIVQVEESTLKDQKATSP